jgi:hypothetical protein
MVVIMLIPLEIDHNRRSLWVKIHVPDEITMQEQAAQFLAGALPEAAGLVRSRLRRFAAVRVAAFSSRPRQRSSKKTRCTRAVRGK